jgi:hypothetical protein
LFSLLIFILPTVSYGSDGYGSDPVISNGIGSSFFSRIKDSLCASSEEIVFGMSDVVVSIFGLVLGVAAGAESACAVFLAGATGAIAVSVSMMAGLYLNQGKAASSLLFLCMIEPVLSNNYL